MLPVFNRNKVLEKVLVHSPALIIIFCTYSFIVCYICCHVAAYELDLNKLISMRDYEKTSPTLITLANGQLLKMI